MHFTSYLRYIFKLAAYCNSMEKAEYQLYLSEDYEFTLYSDAKYKAVLHDEPWTKGHVCVLTLKPFMSLAQMPPVYRDGLLKVAKTVCEQLTTKLHAKSFHIMINEGAIANPGNIVTMEIIPRYSKREMQFEHRVHKDRLDKIYSLLIH